MNKKLLVIPALVLGALVATLGFSTRVSAASLSGMFGIGLHNGWNVKAETETEVGDDNRGFRGGPAMMNGHVVFGTVTAINGSVITLSSKAINKDAETQSTTTYTVNTSSTTTIDKNRAASSISGIAIGDSIMVQGTIDGTTITATAIHDGVVAKGMMPGANGSATLPEGNGQPVIGGKVTAINGNTVTITNSSNASYTIDVTNAKITKSGAASTVSSIAVGDEVIAQGTINGNAVTAVTLVDGASATAHTDNGLKVGIFGKIGGFFKHLFGFGSN